MNVSTGVGFALPPNSDPLEEVLAGEELGPIAAFREGRSTLLETAEAAEAYYERAMSRWQAASTAEDRKLAAKGAGLAYRWAMANGDVNDALNTVTLLSQVCLSLPGSDHDRGSAVSAELFARFGAWCAGRGASREAGVCATSEAMALATKHFPEEGDRERAQAVAAEAFAFKQRGTADWRYSVFTAAVVTTRMAPDADVEALARGRKQLERSIRNLPSDVEPDLFIRGAIDVVAAEVRLIEALVDSDDRENYARNVHRLRIPDFNGWDGSEREWHDHVRSGLRTHPETFGLAERPSWLPPEPSRAATLRARRDPAGSVRELLTEAVATHGESASPATVRAANGELAALAWAFEPTQELLERRAAFLGAPSAADDEHWFGEACKLVGQAKEAGLHVPASLALQLAAHCEDLLAGFSDGRIVEFVDDHGTDMRFLACILAELDEPQAAADLLSGVRRMPGLPRTFDVPEGSARVHVTHNPDRTVVLVERPRRDVRAAVVDGGGRDLASGWIALGQSPGATTGQMMGQAFATTAEPFEHALANLEPVIDVISRLTDGVDRLLLVPSGIFTHVPLGSIIEQGAPSRFGLIAEGINTAEPQHRRAQQPASSYVLTAEAPEQPQLPHADSEARCIADALPGAKRADFSDASALRHALSSAQLVHVICHGVADVEVPLRNELQSTSGPVSAADLFDQEEPYIADVVFLNACQSGLNVGNRHASANLTVAGVLALMGVGCTIATTRKTLDISSALIATQFYTRLESSTEPDDVYLALAEAQHWARTATVRQIAAYNDNLPHPFDLPSSWRQLEQNFVPLSAPALWAPYTVVVSTQHWPTGRVSANGLRDSVGRRADRIRRRLRHWTGR